MRKFVVAANWKMNKMPSEVGEFIEGLEQELKGNTSTQVVIAPPFPHLSLFEARKDIFSLAGQDLSAHGSGAFTGEVSAKMLADIGCDYVIIGHSERREYHNEDVDILSAKLNQAISEKLAPIFCCGEKIEERKAGREKEIVKMQLTEVLGKLEASAFENGIVAYEPVWAIGTGEVASPTQVEEMHDFIRQTLVEIFGEVIGLNIPIQYGGSVKPTNAKELFEIENVDGALVGGASLNPKDFAAIILSNK